MKESNVITFADGLKHEVFFVNRNYDVTYNLENGSSLVLKELATTNLNTTLNVNLNSETSSFTASYLAVANNDLINLKQVIKHNAKLTTSDIKNYAFANFGSVNFNTESFVYNGFKKSSAKQLTKGVILTDDSTISAKPILNIYENDVVASHGCAIGKIREEELFYLMSRGLSRKDAVVLITRGIIEPFFLDFSEPDQKETVYLKLEGQRNV